MDNQTNFKIVMATISTVYNKELSAEFINIYWSILGGYKSEFLTKSLQLHIEDQDEGRFCPKPAHLIAHIKNMQGAEKRSIEFNNQMNSRLEHKKASPESTKKVKELLEGLRNEI